MLELESVDQRVFAAVRLLDDVTGAPVTAPMNATSNELELITNRSGILVVTGLKRPTAGLLLSAERSEFVPSRSYSLQIAAGATPAGSIPVSITVRDPAGRYLDRRCALRLVPRAAGDPAGRPIPYDRGLLPSPTFQPWPGSAVIRVTCRAGGVPLPGVLLLVRRATGNEILARGMTGANGDALVLVPRLPVSTWVNPTDADNDGTPDNEAVTTVVTSVRILAHFEASTWDAARQRLTDVPEPDLLQLSTTTVRRSALLNLVAATTFRQTFDF